MAKLLLVLAAVSHALVPTPTARHPTKLHSRSRTTSSRRPGEPA